MNDAREPGPIPTLAPGSFSFRDRHRREVRETLDRALADRESGFGIRDVVDVVVLACRDLSLSGPEERALADEIVGRLRTLNAFDEPHRRAGLPE